MRSQFFPIPNDKLKIIRTGMTLAELLVVLVILAIITITAVKSLTPVVAQARFESTQRTLEQIRLAVVQVDNASVTNAAVSGFVADNGRLPVQITLYPSTPAFPL